MALSEIICTIGPATADPDSWGRLLDAGATGFRIPFAKETPDLQFERALQLSRRAGERFHIYADLPGDAPRTANAGPVELRPGVVELIAANGTGQGGRDSGLPVQGLDRVAAGVAGGTWLSFGDGELGGYVRSVDGSRIAIEVVAGGTLRQRRRISWLGCEESTRTLGAYDLQLLRDPRMRSFTGVMISYVRSADVVKRARAEVVEGHELSVCAKVEDTTAVANIEQIGESADSVLVGQGDLLTSSGVEDFVRSIQRVVGWRRSGGRGTLLVGTGLLEGFAAGAPTRAELGYLALLRTAGVDGIMLSAETTIGDDPERVVRLARLALGGASR
ncbi:MAG TPA: pyruvate kinase [Streptosporangiaceae bacterium]